MGSMDDVKLPIVVRDATAGDVASMQAVDVEARQRFREIDDPRIAACADDPHPRASLVSSTLLRLLSEGSRATNDRCAVGGYRR